MYRYKFATGYSYERERMTIWQNRDLFPEVALALKSAGQVLKEIRLTRSRCHKQILE